jgi:DNA excision repair protein ERCC-4
MVKIYVDNRERESEVPRYLSEMGVAVIFKQLEVGDYIIAENVVAERKSVSDLARSVFDGRFFDQLSRLAERSERFFLLVEGDIGKIKLVTSNYKAVLSALYFSSVLGRVPVVFTEGPRHSAELLKYLASKLQESPLVLRTTRVSRGKPKDAPLSEWQLYVVSALPGVGVRTAERLLRKFGSVKGVFNASLAELASVEGVSEEKASFIFRVVNEPYTKKRQAKDLSNYTKKS